MIAFILLALTTFVNREDLLIAPSTDHVLISKNVFYDTVTLEDQSTWVVAPPDVYKISGWEPRHAMMLTPHHSYFSSYKFQYTLSNLTLKSSVRVNFVSHPCDYTPKCRWVISLNTYANRLFLNDGSTWKIHPDDAPLFKDWGINDFIVYGKNDQLLTTFPFILINTRLDHFVRAVDK
jgi:hypothetical protein